MPFDKLRVNQRSFFYTRVVHRQVNFAIIIGMLKKAAFAKALTLACGLFYLFVYLLNLLAPSIFKLFLNAQFFGADIASVLPAQLTFIGFLRTLVVIMATGWIFGYLWAALYNRFQK